MTDQALDARRADLEDIVRWDEETPDTIRARAKEVAAALPEGLLGPGVAPGDRIGAFEVVEPLGGGGQALVFRARHVHLGREVALKIPRREVAERLLKEARLLAKLDHPRIVSVEHVEPEGPVPYLVLECVDGGTLDELIARFPDGLPLPRVKEIAEAVLDALAAAHEAGIVHRDIKPSNILFDGAGTAKVCDFGIGTVAIAGTVDGSLVSLGTMLAGTPLYMAPEQEDPTYEGRIDGRADLYAVGKLIFHMLTGRRPRTLRPPSQLREGLDPAWDALVLRLTEERPEDRYQDAAAALETLATLPTGAARAAAAATVGAGDVSDPLGADADGRGWFRYDGSKVGVRDRQRHVVIALTLVHLMGGWLCIAAGLSRLRPGLYFVGRPDGVIAMACGVAWLAAFVVWFGALWGLRARGVQATLVGVVVSAICVPLLFCGATLALSIAGGLGGIDPAGGRELRTAVFAGVPMGIVGLVGLVVLEVAPGVRIWHAAGGLPDALLAAFRGARERLGGARALLGDRLPKPLAPWRWRPASIAFAFFAANLLAGLIAVGVGASSERSGRASVERYGGELAKVRLREPSPAAWERRLAETNQARAVARVREAESVVLGGLLWCGAAFVAFLAGLKVSTRTFSALLALGVPPLTSGLPTALFSGSSDDAFVLGLVMTGAGLLLTTGAFVFGGGRVSAYTVRP